MLEMALRKAWLGPVVGTACLVPFVKYRCRVVACGWQHGQTL